MSQVRNFFFSVWILTVLLFGSSVGSEEIENVPLYTLSQERKTLYNELPNLGPDDFLILNFTSSFCIPCKEEVPRLLSLVDTWTRSGRSSGKLVLWIVFLEDTRESAQTAAQDLKIGNRAEVLYDTLNTSMRRLRFSGTPTSYVVKGDRKILFKGSGYSEENWNRMLSTLGVKR